MQIADLRKMSVEPTETTYQGPPVEVKLAGDDFVVTGIRPLEVDRIKLIPGARHQRTSDEWRMPATRSQAAALSGVFAGRLNVSPSVREHVQWLFGPKPVRPEFSMNEAEELRAQASKSPHLYDFQAKGVEFLCSAGSALLGDEMGTGKTIQAIEWMKHFSRRGPNYVTHLVVCPNSLKYNWADEIRQWWPDVDVTVIDGTATQRRKQIENSHNGGHVVLIINYESLRAHTKLAPWGGRALTEKQKELKDLNDLVFRCVVVDEAHKIKDPKSQQTMAVKQMGAQAEHRLALTGTPLLNNPDDLWSIWNFIAPREAGSRTQFRNRYCLMQNAWHGGFENLGLRPELIPEFDRWFQPRFLRRTKTQVLPQLPEKYPIRYHRLPLTTKQKTLYKAMVKDMMSVIEEDLLLAENPLTLMIRLRQIACATPVLQDGEVVALTNPSNKLQAIQDMLDGEPLVVYAESRRFIEFLHENLYLDHRVGLITGKQNAKQRQQAIEEFQAGKLDIMLGTLGAGAEGITLTRSSRIVLAQQSWAHATNAQAIDRVHRIGQARAVQPIVLVSDGTIDQSVALVDQRKESRLQDLVRDPDWVRRALIGEIS